MKAESKAETAVLTTKAPTRIDFAGGWTDTPPYSADKGGSVVNAAITLYINAELTLNPKDTAERITIRSIDYDMTVTADSIADLELDGNADFAKAALRSLPVDCPLQLVTSSDIPPGSGLGGSGALGVALTKVLSEARGDTWSGIEIPERARDIEVEELKVLGGKQDQYAGMLGGFHYFTFKDPEVGIFPLALLDTTVEKLRQNSVLAYTGQSRSSSNIHRNVVEAYHAGNRETLKALDAIKDSTNNMRDALLENDLDGFAEMMNRNWAAQKALHPSTTNQLIESAFSEAMAKGAVTGKALGAGGGGCIYFYCEPGTRNAVAEAVEKTGCEILTFDFDFRGLTFEKS